MLAKLLDRLIAFAARDEAALLAAREEWATAGARVFDDDPIYEEVTTAFLEWYSLERVGQDGRLPVERWLEEERLTDDERRWGQGLARTHRSLFEVREVREGAFLVDDLLAGGVYEVSERRKLPGIAAGSIFEARLIADVENPPELLFTRAFQFHPADAAPAMRKIAERARAADDPRAATLFRLMRLRDKASHYTHVAAAKIYEEQEA
jgi:hypothetical protein